MKNNFTVFLSNMDSENQLPLRSRMLKLETLIIYLANLNISKITDPKGSMCNLSTFEERL
jgi:hypothetical protein